MLRGKVVRRRPYGTFEQLGDFCDLWATVAGCRELRAAVGLKVQGGQGRASLVVPQTTETLGKASIES